MAFPKNLNNVKIKGFKRNILKDLVRAIENKEIKWIKINTYYISSCGDFIWKKDKYHLEEVLETVVSIEKYH